MIPFSLRRPSSSDCSASSARRGKSPARDLGGGGDDVFDARALTVVVAKRGAQADPGARGLGERAPGDHRLEGVRARYPLGRFDNLAAGDRAAGFVLHASRRRARDRPGNRLISCTAYPPPPRGKAMRSAA